MNKKMFELYWTEQGQVIDRVHHNGYDYAYIELRYSDNLQQQGYDKVRVVGKFLGEDLVCAGYDSKAGMAQYGLDLLIDSESCLSDTSDELYSHIIGNVVRLDV